jgi:hypothetical protein
MSTKLLNELDQYEKTLVKYRKLFAPGGITKDEQKKLDSIQAKINSIIKKLTVEGEVIDVSAPPPSRPSDIDGEIQYEGIPLDKIKEPYKKNVARENARRVRDGIKSVDGWGKHFDARSKDHTAKQTKYQMIQANSEDVNAAFDKDLKGKGFEKLRDKEGVGFSTTLASYEKASADIDINYKKLEAQAWAVAAAQAMLSQAEMLLESYNSEKERDAEGKKLAELKQKLEDLKGGVNFVIDVVKDPKGAAKDLAKKAGVKIREAVVNEIVDGLLGGAKLNREISEIEGRIKRLNEKLDELKLGGIKGGINQAFSTIKAEEGKTEAIQQEFASAKTAQGQAVDHLADIEKRHAGTTTTFSKMQEYFDNVQNAGAEMQKESQDYEKEMIAARGSMSHTAKIRESVLKDSSDMRKLYDGEWAHMDVLKQEEHAKTIVAYTKSVDEWVAKQDLDKQLQEQQQLQVDLRRNKQFEYIGKLVNEVQQQGLGHTQRDSKRTK